MLERTMKIKFLTTRVVRGVGVVGVVLVGLAAPAPLLAQYDADTLRGRPPCTATRTTNCILSPNASGNVAVSGSLSVGTGVFDGADATINKTPFASPRAAAARAGTEYDRTLTVALVGDSNIEHSWITNSLRKALQNRYGNAGIGYIALNATTSTALTVTSAGTWTDSAAGHGINLFDTTSTDAATPGSKALTTFATSFVIHYYKRPDAGSFRWRIDSGSWTTVSAVGSGYATEVISNQTYASHLLTLEVVSAGTSGVTLMGVDCQLPVPGARVAQLGHTGKATGDYVGATASDWQAGITALAPQMVGILLGTNDATSGVSLATYAANLTTLINRVKAASPTASVVLLSPPDRGDSTSIPIRSYIAAARAVAILQGVGYVDLLAAVGDYAVASALGLYDVEDMVHLSQYGGKIASVAIQQALGIDFGFGPVLAINNGIQSAYPPGITAPSIYQSGDLLSGAFPHDSTGNLVFLPRTDTARTIVLANGNPPVPVLNIRTTGAQLPALAQTGGAVTCADANGYLTKCSGAAQASINLTVKGADGNNCIIYVRGSIIESTTCPAP